MCRTLSALWCGSVRCCIGVGVGGVRTGSPGRVLDRRAWLLLCDLRLCVVYVERAH